MPISIDSSGGVALDYSIKNVNKIDNTKKVEIPSEEKQQSNNTQTQARQELPKEEVEALFFNRQDSQLTRDILNTYASKQDSTNEISFSNIDAYEKLLENDEPLPEIEPEAVENSDPQFAQNSEAEPAQENNPEPEVQREARNTSEDETVNQNN